MKNFNVVFACLLLINCSLIAQQKKSNLVYVDQAIGGVGLILEPTRPTIQLPNQLIRVFPVRKDALDDQISYFPLTIASHRVISLFSFMPVSGADRNLLWDKKQVYNYEVLTPYYYRSELGDEGNLIEFSPSEKSGFFKISFKDNSNNYLRMGILNESGQITVAGKRVLTGTEIFKGMKAYFYAETDADISEAVTKTKGMLIKAPQKLSFKYAISYISIEQAKQNLRLEIPGWDFNKVKTTAYHEWDKVMSQINVEGGTTAQKRVFYTSLYRCYERMVDINEHGQYYSAFDHQVHQSNKPFFVDNWIWDTYIALGPLQMILNPAKEADKISSYITMYQQDGWMPSFALIFGDWPAMTGNHAASWIADAWFKGIRNFDLRTAYAGLRKNSVGATLLPWNNGPATALDSFYNKHGYMPGLHYGEAETVPQVENVWEKRQAVSVTLENSFSDWNISRLAAELNLPEDEELFMSRSKNYRNVYRKDKGFMWAKDKDGNWIDMDPKSAGREFFTENNAYTYNWVVKHDFKGLFNLMGGTKQAENKLDQLFREDLGTAKFIFWKTQPDASGLVGQFVMGNEPSFHIPYLYNYMGAPWKTQKRIRMLLNTWYTDNLFGIPGDEDGGGMTSFVVFSMMGFFPVTAGIPVYNIGSPVFTKVTINLPNGKVFTINAADNSADNKYIQSATLNGARLNKPWFAHTDLVNGATINFKMGSRPNRNWGSAIKDAPPSDGDLLYLNNKW
ncbi:GH92 family glycosyl hydrolase [Mucilaginibacter sp. UR6-11]|uniref:GH92 family glycosyl hydrolase n=1 Tax=Mucilaginibacter sp. UR6-11 TaxID=1435644 RepID=UPI001E33143A|nr:GH92 family glycosyl hydrolase [Mucilaginibacter sp. UR6-11]MCC8426312.1 glycoside hydrolase family 92 protein [Mucilaginibacter sp. UR6-11]